MDSQSFDYYWLAQGTYDVPLHQNAIFDMPPELEKSAGIRDSTASIASTDIDFGLT